MGEINKMIFRKSKTTRSSVNEIEYDVKGIDQPYKLINYIIQLKGYKSYLEVGVHFRYTFDRVICDSKLGMDPKFTERVDMYQLTSDDFFEMNKTNWFKKFDIVFIDGLHQAKQVLKDLQHSIDSLSPDGIVLLHDCLPNSKEIQEGDWPTGAPWTGNVWKAMVDIRSMPFLDSVTLDSDWGFGMVINRPNSCVLEHHIPRGGELEGLQWEDYEKDRQYLLRMIKNEDIVTFLKGGKKIGDLGCPSSI